MSRPTGPETGSPGTASAMPDNSDNEAASIQALWSGEWKPTPPPPEPEPFIPDDLPEGLKRIEQDWHQERDAIRYRAEFRREFIREAEEQHASRWAQLPTAETPLPTASANEEALKQEYADLSAISDPLQREIADAAFINALEKRFGRTGAQKVYRALASSSVLLEPFEHVNGNPVLRTADPGAMNLSTRWLADQRIPAAAIGELIADYSCGKTWLLIDLALSVAFGRPFFGASTSEGPVLFLTYEGQRGVWGRIAGWLNHHGFLPATTTTSELRELLAHRVIVAAAPARFDHPGLEHGLLNTIQQFGIRLAVIDTRSKSLGSDQKEDSADIAGHVNGMLSRIATATDCTFISAHHTGHKEKNRSRGSSGWTQGVDFSYILEGNKESFAAGKMMLLKPTKMRDDSWPQPAGYRLVPIPHLSIDGIDMSSAVIVSADGSDHQSDYERYLLFAEANPGHSKKVARQAIGGNARAADKLIERAMTRGDIENRPAGNAWHLYRRTAADDFAHLDRLVNPDACIDLEAEI